MNPVVHFEMPYEDKARVALAELHPDAPLPAFVLGAVPAGHLGAAGPGIALRRLDSGRAARDGLGREGRYGQGAGDRREDEPGAIPCLRVTHNNLRRPAWGDT